ncbi:MAG: extracellular solute-binding protein [Bacilli bacterium]|nr:extracellular solute-binding protein [Bacilli bacterium]
MRKTALLSLFSLLLPACASAGVSFSASTSTEEGAYFIKNDTDISFLCMADKKYYPSLQKIVKDFMKVEPHVRVHLVNPQGTGSYAMIEKNVVAGFFKEDYPDIVQCYPDNVVKYLAQGYAVNLSPYLESPIYGLSKEEREDYIASFLNEGTGYAEKGTYSLPFCKSTELLYYNADVLLGMDLSSIDPSINGGQPLDETYLGSLNWEELLSRLCPAIEEYNAALPEEKRIYDPASDHAIVTYDSDENCFITLAHQYGFGYTRIDGSGKGVVEFDNEGMKEIVTQLYEAKNKNYFRTRRSNGMDYVSSLFVSRHNLFTVSSTASLSYNYNEAKPFSIGVAKLPKAANKSLAYSSINQGPSICILDHEDEDRKAAAFLLWKYLTNEENSNSWALETGYLGIRNSSYSSPEYQKAIATDEKSTIYDRYVAANLRASNEVRGSLFNTAVFRGSSNARTNVGLLLGDCLNSNNLAEEIDSLFASYEEDAKNYLAK